MVVVVIDVVVVDAVCTKVVDIAALAAIVDDMPDELQCIGLLWLIVLLRIFNVVVAVDAAVVVAVVRHCCWLSSRAVPSPPPVLWPA